MNACDHCGNVILIDPLITPSGTFCDKQCHDGETLQPLPVFEGWDEGSPLTQPADLVSRKHNQLFLNWERTARKEV